MKKIVKIASTILAMALAAQCVAVMAFAQEPAADSYQLNAYGKTYGSAANAASEEEEPDLILAEGTNGTVGYIRAEDEVSAENGSGRSIPLYAADGQTVIGEFAISGDNTDTEAGPVPFTFKESYGAWTYAGQYAQGRNYINYNTPTLTAYTQIKTNDGHQKNMGVNTRIYKVKTGGDTLVASSGWTYRTDSVVTVTITHGTIAGSYYCQGQVKADSTIFTPVYTKSV